MEDFLRVFGPNSELDAFNGEAEKAGLEQKPQIFNFSVGPQNLAPHLDFLLSNDALKMAGLLAAIVTGYLKGKTTRRLTITVSTAGKQKSVDARGYSEEELRRILPACKGMTVFDPTTKNSRQ